MTRSLPLGGMIPLINIELGEIIIGGVGAGLYGMLIYVIIAVFVAGLMVGRTPEYVGKKIEAQGSQDGDARHPGFAADVSRLDGRRDRRSVRGCRRRTIPARTALPRSSTPTPR